ncbi:hypothetical protein ACT6QE_04325, partial [Staphylococcus aureus]
PYSLVYEPILTGSFVPVTRVFAFIVKRFAHFRARSLSIFHLITYLIVMILNDVHRVFTFIFPIKKHLTVNI